VLGRAREAGVAGFVCCATREADWERVLELARREPDVVPMLGIHPWFAAEAQAGWLERLRAALGSARAGVGECGLDGTRGRPGLALQEACFGAQLTLAVALDLPVSIHCVGAWGPLLALLKSHGVPRAGAVAHAFAGSRAVAAELGALGVHLAFNGAVARPGARRGPEALARVAPSLLLLETDAPFGPGPAPEPGDLAEVVRAAARIRGAAPEPLARLTHDNALRVFGSLLR
jgi:TatD DNase family protein